ncbi:hypothetical protein BT69DRAFT_1285547, partial [Atractiella rhizophila]
MVLPSPSLNNATVNAQRVQIVLRFIEIDNQNVGASLRQSCASADYYGKYLQFNLLLPLIVLL